MKAPPEAPRFFTEHRLSVGEELTLEPAVARHMLSALRLKAGAAVRLFNGRGGEYLGTITSADRRSVCVSLDAFNADERESPLAITLGLCVSRGDRMDYALQKSTELGVTAIVPLFSQRAELRLEGDRLIKKQRHWQQVVVSACEQCGRNRLPTLKDAQPLDTWVAESDSALKLVLHPRSQCSLRDYPQTPDSVALLIGPEGGLAEEEIALAQKLGFSALTLGPRVLRTETAPVAAVSLLQHVWGDFS